MKIPELEELYLKCGPVNLLKSKYPDFYDYIINNKKYSHISKVSEKLYWYYYGLIEYPKCKTCGVYITKFRSLKEGYAEYCSAKCVANSDIVREKTKSTNIKKYGVENPNQSNIVREKTKSTNIKKYGVENPFANPTVKEQIKETNIRKYGVPYIMQSKEHINKSVETCLKKYGVSHYSETEECKKRIQEISRESIRKRNETCMNKYGVESCMLLQSIKNKKYNTQRENNSFNSSRIEDEFASWLDLNNISYIRQFKSNEYPFMCDFYFPDKNMYFEIQGLWTHGGHPFNKNSKEDIDILNKWKSKKNKFYANAIYTWTINDPKKRKVATYNNINFIEVFTYKIGDIISEFQKNYY